MRQAIKKISYEGLKIGKNKIEVSLLQFAEDILLLCESRYHNILGIKSILRSFKLWA